MAWKWKLSNLKREDWDFRPECLVESVWWGCYLYEFSREDNALRVAVAQSRKRHPDFVEKYPQQTTSLVQALCEPVPPLAYTVDPRWPDTPFRSLRRSNNPERELPTKFPPDATFYAVRHWSFDQIAHAWEGCEAFPGELKGKVWVATPISTLWCCSEQSDLAVFEIPWRFPDATLTQGFTRWLKDHRPTGKDGDCRPRVAPERKPTGASAELRQLQAGLKALGAYRLLLCYGGNRQKAKDHHDIERVLGKNFQHDSAWTDAKNRAQCMIQQVSELNRAKRSLEKFAGKVPISVLPKGASA